MKVKFDIKYRQQIESGEYEVETVDGRKVRIICWDAHNPYRENDIVALATSSSGESENILRYYSNGHLISDSANTGNKDLMVIIPDEDENVLEALQKLIVSIGYFKINDVTDKVALAWIEKKKSEERYNRMVPIYDDKDSFESALDKAWSFYSNSGSMQVDSFEDNFVECAFAKGFREGFLAKNSKK